MRAPLAADLERPADVWAVLVETAAIVCGVEPRTRAVDRSMAFRISGACLGGGVQQSPMVGFSISAGNRPRCAIVQFEQERGTTNTLAAGTAAIAVASRVWLNWVGACISH